MKASGIGAILGIGIVIFSLVPASLSAQTPPAQTAQLLQPAQLDQLLAPIALYPDELVGQVLMASTYPLEVVEAQRWAQESSNASLKGDQLTAALQGQDWDPSVKSLVPFPQILGMMSDRLSWMQKLGDAFLAQQGDVMDSVQRLRQQAQAAGTLQSSPQQTVTTQDQTITVEPANPNTVYVPVYDPTVVYGTWPYPDYPPYYFEPPPDFIFGPPFWPGFWWGPVVEISYYQPYWGWGHSDWHHHEIHIDHDRFRHIEGKHHFPAGDNWRHDPYHRRGVAYRDPGTGAKFGRTVTGSPDARRIYRGFDSHEGTRGIAPNNLIRPGTTGPPGTSVTGARGTGHGNFGEPRRSTGLGMTGPGGTGHRDFGEPNTSIRRGATSAPGTSGTALGGTGQRKVGESRRITTPTGQSTFFNRAPTVQRPQETIFGGYGRGADIRTQSERGHASQHTIAPRSLNPPSRSFSAPSRRFSAPRASGGRSSGGRSHR